MEIFFTALGSLRRRKMKLVGQTSLYMFPIYGSAALFKPVFKLMKKIALPIRGFFYATVIFASEFASGKLLSKHRVCPWSYERYHWHIDGLIRLDFLPVWFMAGLIFERVLTGSGLNTGSKPHDP